MFIILKNVFCLLIIHLFASAEFFLFLFTSYGGLEPFYSLFSKPILDFFLPALLFFLLSRLLVLPIAYKKLEKSQRFDLVAKFIQRLKQSWHLKIVVLVIAYFSYCNLGASYLDGGFYVKLRNGFFVGLLGNYLVLFAYWFIENKIKQIIQKYRH
jgi:predicted Co/Zn/Cd cation transporter (cation efflux family)